MKRVPNWARLLGLIIGGILFVAQKMERPKRSISWKRILSGFVFISFGLFLSFVVFVALGYDAKFMGKTNNCGVVFGAAVWKDNKPSQALYDRTIAGIELYQNNQIECLVFSGGASTYGAHEVEVMANMAAEYGLPESAIIKDYYGNNTLATIQNLQPGSGYVFISNDFHMARIGLIARKLGFENYYLHGAEYKGGRYLKDVTYFFREVGGSFLVFWGL